MKDNIMVSIICNTFNQEDYIADALESFVMQKTDFEYEILVHDDASTDGTADIIRTYEDKYPGLVKPIYQTENQYSQKIPISAMFQIPRAKGKYIAYCEGDDYWIDPLKLQKQVDALEQHPEIDICTHAANEVEADTKVLRSLIMPAKKNKIFSIADVVSGGGGFVATNSIMMRKECILHEYKFRQFLRYDYTLQMQGSMRGGMLYLSDIMSEYRRLAKGSWSSQRTNHPERLLPHMKKMREMLHVFDEETNYKYHDTVQKKLDNNLYDCLIFEGKDSEARKRYKKIFIERFLFKVKRYIKRNLFKRFD